MPSGRPSKIKGINLEDVEFLASKGYTDKQLAKIFDVTEQTINNWKKDYPVFFESLKKGKVLADAKVEVSLFQRACGYSHPEVHISNYLGKVKKTEIIKHYPPDPTSMIFWLKNRKKDEWRDKQDISLEGDALNINVYNIINQVQRDFQNSRMSSVAVDHGDGLHEGRA